MLNFRSVQKRYRNHLIIDTPAFALPAGIYRLKGANGAGKSTVLKMIAGMIPFEGEIEIEKTNLNEFPVAYRRLVNYGEAEPVYPPFLTGLELIRFFQRSRNAPGEQVNLLQATLGTVAFAGNPVSTYSSGMLKKLSLVLAFIGQPRLVLLDEPLVTLDATTVPILCQLIKTTFEQGVSVIIASHQEIDLAPLASPVELEIRDHRLCVG